MLEQAWHIVVDAVPVQAAGGDQLFIVRQAAQVHAHPDALVQGRQPPGHRAAHGEAQRAQARHIDLWPGLQVVDGPNAVIDHHAPQHLAVPQHLFEELGLCAPAPLPEIPCVATQHAIAQIGQRFSIGRRLQRSPPGDKLILAQLIVATVRVMVEDHRCLTHLTQRPGKVRGHGLDAVQVQYQRLEHIAITFFFTDQRGADGAVAVRDVAEQRIEQLALSCEVVSHECLQRCAMLAV